MANDFSTGFALVSGRGLPLPATVAATERAAMVNAIVAVYGHPVYAGDSDAKIKREFERLKAYGDAVVPVTIKRIPPAPTES